MGRISNGTAGQCQGESICRLHQGAAFEFRRTFRRPLSTLSGHEQRAWHRWSAGLAAASAVAAGNVLTKARARRRGARLLAEPKGASLLSKTFFRLVPTNQGSASCQHVPRNFAQLLSEERVVAIIFSWEQTFHAC